MEVLTRRAASEAVFDVGWRFILGELRTEVLVPSLAVAVDVAGAAAGEAGDGSLRLDLRHDRVLMALREPAAVGVTARQTGLAHRVSAAVARLGLATVPGVESERATQILEIAIDAMDIAAVRPFWKAVMGYTDETDDAGPTGPLVDPWGQGPAIWFQQMDKPRPQRNRIHFDVSVPHDEKDRRIRAALDAGGRLVYDAEAPAFVVLADVEGNEACVTTWLGRDAS